MKAQSEENDKGTTLQNIAIFRYKPRKPQANIFKPGRIRRCTDRYRILVLMDGTRTPLEIGTALGFEKTGYIAVHLFCLWRDCGIGYQFDTLGRISAIYPLGYDFASTVSPDNGESHLSRREQRKIGRAEANAILDAEIA